jgi:hypothetical protein
MCAGDEFYSPLFVLTNGGNYVYNGPIVAGDVTAAELSQYCGGIPENQTEQAYSILHDKVRRKQLREGQDEFVTLLVRKQTSEHLPLL